MAQTVPLRKPSEIEAEIAAARERLAANAADLVNRIHPAVVAQRTADQVRGFAMSEYEQAKAQLMDEDGRWRTDQIAVLGSVIAGVIAGLLVLRAIVRSFGR